MADLPTLFPKQLLRFPFSRFPGLWEEFENQLQEVAWDQTGITTSEDANNFYIEAQMPGLNKDNINVMIENGIVRIEGSRQEKEENKDRRFHRKASYTYSFRIALPVQIDENNPQAVYKEGVMHLIFKKQKQSQAKKIKIQWG
jgi:HSP20 family protein